MEKKHFTGASVAPGKSVSLGHGTAAEIAAQIKRTPDCKTILV